MAPEVANVVFVMVMVLPAVTLTFLLDRRRPPRFVLRVLHANEVLAQDYHRWAEWERAHGDPGKADRDDQRSRRYTRQAERMRQAWDIPHDDTDT